MSFSKTRERLIRFLGPRLVSLATYRARTFFKTHDPISILIDNCTLAFGITHETRWISTGKKKWGPHEMDCGYAARVPVYSHKNDSRTYREIRYLAGIASLARARFLRLHTSTELDRETFAQPMGRYTLVDCGVEDILFKGNWNSYPEEFVHHKDGIHDSGCCELRDCDVIRVTVGAVRSESHHDVGAHSFDVGGDGADRFPMTHAVDGAIDVAEKGDFG